MASFFPIESESSSGLPCDLNLSAHQRQQLRQLLTESADASKTPPAKASEAPRFIHPHGLQAPPCLSAGLRSTTSLQAPPAGLVPPSRLAAPKRSSAVKGRKKFGPGSDGYVESDVEDTSVGTGSISLPPSSDDEDAKTLAKEFQMNAKAPCFAPGWLSKATLSHTTCRQQDTHLRSPLCNSAIFVPHHTAAGVARPPVPTAGAVETSSQYENGELVSIRVDKRKPGLLA